MPPHDHCCELCDFPLLDEDDAGDSCPVTDGREKHTWLFHTLAVFPADVVRRVRPVARNVFLDAEDGHSRYIIHECSDALAIHRRCFEFVKQHKPEFVSVHGLFCHEGADIDRVLRRARDTPLSNLRPRYYSSDTGRFRVDKFVAHHGDTCLTNPESRLRDLLDVLTAGYAP